MDKIRQELIFASKIDFTYILCNADKVGSDYMGNAVDFHFHRDMFQSWRMLSQEKHVSCGARRYLNALKP